MSNGLKWLRRKTSKGGEYFYFDTGEKNDLGKPILIPMPSPTEPSFAARYAAAVGARTKRKNRADVLTVAGLYQRWQKSPEFVKLAANTKRSYVRYAGIAVELLVDRHGRSIPARSVQSQDVAAVRDKHFDNKGAASQIVRATGAMFAWGAKPERKMVPFNPAHGVSTYPSEPHEPWPDELLEEALKDPQVGMAVGLFYFTGQRIGDVVRMRWSDIRGDLIKVNVEKTKDEMEIPYLGELADMLARQERKTLTILHNSNGRPWSKGGMRDKLKAWALERGHKVVPHGLRKNAVNSLLLAGCTPAEVSGITGQSMQMVEHYAKQINRTQLGRNAVIKLDEARKNKRGQ